MIFYCTKFHFSKFNGSWVVSMKQNVNFKFQPPVIFVFLFYGKSDLIKGCSSFEGLSEYTIWWFHIE
jgi:hypothetical protein